MNGIEAQRFEGLDIRYPGIQPAQGGGGAICLNDFVILVSGRATYEDVEEALLDEDVVDVTPMDDDRFLQIGCKVADCGVKLILERGEGYSSSPGPQCSLDEQLFN